MKALTFSLPDQNNKTHSLSDYKGNWVVLYFYPKDDTPGCTKEACGFRDLNEEYRAKGVVVLGVSKDSVESHKKFAQKHHLTFPLLSDREGAVIKQYGAWGVKKFMGRTFEGILRKSFLINPDGDIVKTFDKVDVFSHAKDILKEISEKG